MSEDYKAGASGVPGDAIVCKPVEVMVGERGLERAIKHLKRKMAAEGILRELKRRRHHMKPSIKKRKKEAEAARRRRKRDKTIVAGPAKPGEVREGREGAREGRENRMG